MAPVDVILMIKDFDRRLTAVEQSLPTLATKEDLKVYPTRIEMEEKFEEARRFALVLHEDLKSDIGLMAEHVADLMTRVPRRGKF